MVDSLRGMNPTRLALLGLGAAVFIIIFGFLSTRLTEPVLSPLYSQLETDDATAIVAELGAMGVKFSVATNGTEILVPSSDVLNLRMALAEKGLPARGSIVGYEIFDKSESLGTSNFVHNVNYIRALEGELGRTIKSFNSIRDARVHLVVPKRQLFRAQDTEPSASVVLTLNGRQAVSSEQIASIRNLIATAVPGLKLKHITVVDNSGKLLARGASDEEDEAGGVSASNADEYRRNFETRLKQAVEQLVEKTVGPDSVRAEVTAEIAFDRVVTNAEVYDPEGQVVRSVQTSTATENSQDRQDQPVSVLANLPGPGVNDTGAASSNNVEKVDEITNFEISKTITNRVSEVGNIKRLSVAVLVDGKYETGADGTTTYINRTDEEIDRIRTLVSSAIGYDGNRGDQLEIVNMQFQNSLRDNIEEPGPLDFLKNDLDSIIKTLVMGAVAILAILLVIRPLVNRAFDVSTADLEGTGSGMLPGGELGMLPGEGNMALLGGGGGEEGEINVDEIQSRVNSSSTQKVNDLVTNNPEATLSLIRSWLGNQQ
ncbi:MAG: flagellar M-ring protein FliF [Rickettsiales bacterium]|nr:flagellar M-ring protein FliF [Rickettsiales bacterium]